jgi:hypothetical protein
MLLLAGACVAAAFVDAYRRPSRLKKALAWCGAVLTAAVLLWSRVCP